jgi:prepilin-type N-terminal cleavage/methylation domain-containing protein
MNMQNNEVKPKNKQGGFTLLELTIGLIIFGIIAAAFAPMLLGAKDETLTATEATAMNRTVGKLEGRFDGEAWGAAIDNDEMISGELVAENYKIIKATGTIYNQYGGTILIDGIDFNGLTWESNKIPKIACAALVAEVKNYSIFQQVDIGSTNLQYSSTANTDYISTCESEAGTDDSLTITWYKEEA